MNNPDKPDSSTKDDDQVATGVPRHVSIIMDGNGRWAKARGLPREAGHERGVEALRRTVEAAGELGIEYLSVFSFSTENWRRPENEINSLFGLLRAYVKRDLERLVKDGVRVHVVGSREGLPADVLDLLIRAENRTAENSKHHLVIAFNYGARLEIVTAVKRLANDVLIGTIKPEQINEDALESRLFTAGIPNPDLLIRTSGEKRLSNFFLWQSAYTELVFVDHHWPDFDKAALEAAIDEYRARNRRYGGL